MSQNLGELQKRCDLWMFTPPNTVYTVMATNHTQITVFGGMRSKPFSIIVDYKGSLSSLVHITGRRFLDPRQYDVNHVVGARGLSVPGNQQGGASAELL
jgi:hypothetical protein